MPVSKQYVSMSSGGNDGKPNQSHSIDEALSSRPVVMWAVSFVLRTIPLEECGLSVVCPL